MITRVSNELINMLINAVNSIYNKCYDKEQLTAIYIFTDNADLYFGEQYHTVYYTLNY